MKEKSHTNATNATMPHLKQATWGHIWKRTVEKGQTNAANVTMHPLRQAIWGDIWKCTVEKSQTNATNVTLHLLGQAIWGHTCYTKIPKNTGILFSKIPVSVFESNPGIPVFSGIPQGPDHDSVKSCQKDEKPRWRQNGRHWPAVLPPRKVNFHPPVFCWAAFCYERW